MTYPKIKNTSYLMSLGVHGLILALFLLIRASFSYTPTEYVEIGFGTPGGSGGGGNGETQILSEDPQAGDLAQQTAPPQDVVEEAKKNEDIPKVETQKTQNTTEDRLPSKTEKPKENPASKTGLTGKEVVKPGNGSPAAGIGTNPLGTGIGNGIGRGSGNGNGSGDANGDGYDIFWGGKGNRKIYSYVLPRYPEGVSKEIDLKLKFTILPDGTVGTIFTLTKADTRLESSAINSLRQWRFEPLPPGQKQLEQTAVIVFPYRLQ